MERGCAWGLIKAWPNDFHSLERRCPHANGGRERCFRLRNPAFCRADCQQRLRVLDSDDVHFRPGNHADRKPLFKQGDLFSAEALLVFDEADIALPGQIFDERASNLCSHLPRCAGQVPASHVRQSLRLADAVPALSRSFYRKGKSKTRNPRTLPRGFPAKVRLNTWVRPCAGRDNRRLGLGEMSSRNCKRWIVVKRGQGQVGEAPFSQRPGSGCRLQCCDELTHAWISQRPGFQRRRTLRWRQRQRPVPSHGATRKGG